MGRLLEKRRKQSEGAGKTNAAKRIGNRNGQRDGEGVAPEQNRKKQNQTPSTGKDGSGAMVSADETAQYERAFDDAPVARATTASAYRQASGR